jgi:hypothetical protein
MKDITIIIPEGGGAVPELWEALEAAAIEVEAAISFSREHHRVIHIVVADTGAQEAADVLVDSGYLIVDRRDVLVLDLVENGGLASITRTAYNADAGVYLLSLATGNRVMLGVANLAAAREAFGLATG